ncbi:MAG: transporter permease [Thermoleophilia bacterium]|nr:transporter permease [Thermoleophilia bacterium]
MNATVAKLTFRSLLGRRRALVFFALPAVLIALTVVAVALTDEVDGEILEILLGAFGLGTLVPLLSVIAGTGAIGPEIEDGSILYVLAKPLRRSVIIISKLVVAIGVAIAFGALPIFACAVLATGEVSGAAIAYGTAAAVASIAYCSLFLLLAVVSRNAVVIGLLYAIVWETVVGQFVPGIRTLSVQQWSITVTDRLVGDHASEAGLDPSVGSIAIFLFLAVVVGSTWQATRRLRTIRLGDDG